MMRLLAPVKGTPRGPESAPTRFGASPISWWARVNTWFPRTPSEGRPGLLHLSALSWTDLPNPTKTHN